MIAADHCLRKHRAIVDHPKTPSSGQTAPRERLARRQSIPPRRRRYLPPPIVALAHDPALLFQRPTTPGTSLDHLKSRHLRHSRMISHTPMSSPPHPSHKAVLSAGIHILLRKPGREPYAMHFTMGPEGRDVIDAYYLDYARFLKMVHDGTASLDLRAENALLSEDGPDLRAKSGRGSCGCRTRTYAAKP